MDLDPAATNPEHYEVVFGGVNWLPVQEHCGENVGDTETRVLFVELKEPTTGTAEHEGIGPQPS